MHQFFILSHLPLVYLLLLAFLLFGRMSQVFFCVLTHTYCVRGVISVLLLYAAYEFVACFVLSNWMDVNMTTLRLRLHPTQGSPNNVCLVANSWYNCSTRSDMRSEFGESPRERPSGKKRQVWYTFGPAGQLETARGSW